MKNAITLFFVLFSICALVGQTKVNIPAGENVVLNYSEYEACEATLKNKGLKSIDVAVVSKESDKQLRGFGLGKMAKEKIMVEGTSNLVLKNSSDKDIMVDVSVLPVSMDVFKEPKGAVSFTLQNSSLKSIPLIIPSVMNPNLSPDSMSGVTLKMGQEIFFKAKGKKQILLIVDNSIKDGDVIDVAKLLPVRKKALGIR